MVRTLAVVMMTVASATAVPVGRDNIAFELWAGEFGYPFEDKPSENSSPPTVS